MARPGYGKRSAPDQLPRKGGDFAHLPPREASIATHIDRLPEGAAMDVKTLARELPDYGQQAVRSALNNLCRQGHLRRVRDQVSGGTQWVWRSYFSRTAREESWWSAYLGRQDATPEHSRPPSPPQAPPDPEPRETPPPSPPPPPPPPPPSESSPTPSPNPSPEPPPVPAPTRTPAPAPTTPPATSPVRSPAYTALASLGRVDPRMTLAAAECAALEPLAAEWLARGVTPDHLARALTAGLPPQVHCPGAFARKRLTMKLPPEPEPTHVLARAEGAPPSGNWVLVCVGCDRPGDFETLPDGLCRDCRDELRREPGHLPATFRPEPAAPPPAVDVHAHADRIRAAMRKPG
ncbi:hypothetical protein [Wenjunlia vitaminophila]|nr:hypothetical protein [Wenjunlia vitaminophila]